MKYYPNINEVLAKQSMKGYMEARTNAVHPLPESVLDIDKCIAMLESLPFQNDGLLKTSLKHYRTGIPLTDRAKEIFDLLLENDRIRHKVKAIPDSTYFMNCIVSVIDETAKVDLSPRISEDLDTAKFYELSTRKQIEWIDKHFDTIFMQIYLNESYEEIYDNISRIVEYMRVMKEVAV